MLIIESKGASNGSEFSESFKLTFKAEFGSGTGNS